MGWKKREKKLRRERKDREARKFLDSFSIVKASGEHLDAFAITTVYPPASGPREDAWEQVLKNRMSKWVSGYDDTAANVVSSDKNSKFYYKGMTYDYLPLSSPPNDGSFAKYIDDGFPWKAMDPIGVIEGDLEKGYDYWSGSKFGARIDTPVDPMPEFKGWMVESIEGEWANLPPSKVDIEIQNLPCGHKECDEDWCYVK